MLEWDHSFQCLAEYSCLCVGLKMVSYFRPTILLDLVV